MSSPTQMNVLDNVALRNLMVLSTHRKTGDLDESGDTEFSAMSATIVFVDGVASNDDLDLKSPLI